MSASLPALRRPVSIAVAAKYAGVHPRTIRRMISRGDVQGFRFGPRILRVDLDDIEAMLRRIPTAGGGHDAA